MMKDEEGARCTQSLLPSSAAVGLKEPRPGRSANR
jgi:hypothetical protein